MLKRKQGIDIILRPGPVAYLTAAIRHTAKRDVIHKTGSTQLIGTPPEKDRARTTGDLHTKFHEDRSSSSRDMLADRDRQTVVTILRTPTGAE